MNIDSSLVLLLVVLVIAFLAISIVAIHWIIVNTQGIANNAIKIDKNIMVNKNQEEKIKNNTDVNTRQDSNIRYLNSTIGK